MSPRQDIAAARRIVIKLGPHVIPHPESGLALGRLCSIVEAVAALHRQGREIVNMTNSIKDNDSSDDYNVKALPQAPITESPPTCIHLTIPSDHAGLRLDQALAKLLPNWSRNRLQSWINNNCVTIDGKTPTSKQKIWGSEQIVI